LSYAAAGADSFAIFPFQSLRRARDHMEPLVRAAGYRFPPRRPYLPASLVGQQTERACKGPPASG
jgi:hypothetical protein